MYYKVHESEYGKIIAACDDSILGKTLKDKGVEFFVNPRFYGDKKISKKRLVELFANCYAANLIGKQVVALAEELGVIDKKNIIKVKGIPHAQFFIISQ